MTDIIEQLQEKREAAWVGRGQKRIDVQHAKGKLTARERITFYLTTTALKSWTPFSSIAVPTLAWTNKRYGGVPP